MKQELLANSYKYILRPLLFANDPEFVHDRMTKVGHFLGEHAALKKLTEAMFAYKNTSLERDILGAKFSSPVGLSAGFDYDGHMVKIMKHVGFGFNTVGTVTNLPYEGNKKPRMVRLVNSGSIIVNKGFKSDGVEVIAKRLDDPELKDTTFGVSVGSSNVPQINTINKAIEDYVACFSKLLSNPYIKYYELNISCPNTEVADGFSDPKLFDMLTEETYKLPFKVPVFVKMPNEINTESAKEIVDIGLKKGLRGYIFSNLNKNKNNPALHPQDSEKAKKYKGYLSGMPTKDNANRLIREIKNIYGKDIEIIGCGGIFSPEDAEEKLELGASLVQLITGMIFVGPQLAGSINKYLAGSHVPK